jgi:2-succinyl-5-enolpyruvyl-6-hydroxy-3-cyclohexene-1-carboxylate synthase
MSKEQNDAIDRFCDSNNAVVFCDHTSGYKGKFRVPFSLVASQRMLDLSSYCPNLLIHIGEVTGDYYNLYISGKQVWRVSEDGEIRDTYGRLRYVFEMTEQTFFEHYSKSDNVDRNSYFQTCKTKLDELRCKLPDMPFSNIWVASKLAHRVPEGSFVYLGILNSLRAWNFFEFPDSVTSASNVGGFGIDGGVSSLIGASLFNKDKLYFAISGDLAFFYDMNVIGNRHVGKNVRILLVNNGKGTEFRNFNTPGARFGDDADKYIAAGGHFGNKSKTLIKHYAQNLGYEYLCASDKQEFEEVYERFLTAEITERPILFEVFTDNVEESDALAAITAIGNNKKGEAKQLVKQFLGKKRVSALRKTLGR